MKDDYYHQRFQEIVEADAELYAEEFREELWPALLDSSVRYHGSPVKFVYTPYIIGLEQWRFYRSFIKTFVGIANNVIEEYLHNPSFRELFPFSSEMEEYILLDPGYDSNFPVARFDILFDGEGNIKFCELNTDGTSAMNEVRVMQEILAKSKAVKKLCRQEDISLYGFELFRSWINILLDKYRQFAPGYRMRPTVAIVDFATDGVKSEFQQFKRFMEEWGLKALIVDPRELEYDGERLFYEDMEIDLIYRRATTARIFEHLEEVGDLLAAYKNRDVCVCGGFRSQILHNKAIFQVLYDYENLDFLSAGERSFLERYILPTGPVKEEIIEGEKIINDKDDYILKPCDSFAGKGIKLGRKCRPDEWRSSLEEACEESYLYQEFCRPGTIDLFTAAEEKIGFEPYHFTLGFYLYDEELKGLYNRAGRYDIIGSDYECVTVPSYVAASENTAVRDLCEEVKYG